MNCKFSDFKLISDFSTWTESPLETRFSDRFRFSEKEKDFFVEPDLHPRLLVIIMSQIYTLSGEKLILQDATNCY